MEFRHPQFGNGDHSGPSRPEPAPSIRRRGWSLSAGGRIASYAAGQTKGVISSTGVIRCSRHSSTNYATIASSLGASGVAVQLGGQRHVGGRGRRCADRTGPGRRWTSGAGIGRRDRDHRRHRRIDHRLCLDRHSSGGWLHRAYQAIAAAVMLRNAAAIVDDGSLTNDGTIEASAPCPAHHRRGASTTPPTASSTLTAILASPRPWAPRGPPSSTPACWRR